ncbi:MAG: hypothetical protein JKY30_07545 [Flavobacteriales bacterium]|nr:hypothetical protein [Flavobacteriales bacterium]
MNSSKSILIISLIITNSLFGQNISEYKKIENFKSKILINEQKIKLHKKSIDSLKLIISKNKFASLNGQGISCKVNMIARVKSPPELFEKELFRIPYKKSVQVISFVLNSNNYYRILYKGKMGFMSEIYFNKDCNLELLKKKGIPYNKEKDFLGDEIKPPNLSPSKKSTTYKYKGTQKIHTGPRGGKYYINSNGNKTYIKQ